MQDWSNYLWALGPAVMKGNETAYKDAKLGDCSLTPKQTW